LRTRAIPERLRGVFTTRNYTNPRLPLPYLTPRTYNFTGQSMSVLLADECPDDRRPQLRTNLVIFTGMQRSSR